MTDKANEGKSPLKRPGSFAQRLALTAAAFTGCGPHITSGITRQDGGLPIEADMSPRGALGMQAMSAARLGDDGLWLKNIAQAEGIDFNKADNHQMSYIKNKALFVLQSLMLEYKTAYEAYRNKEVQGVDTAARERALGEAISKPVVEADVDAPIRSYAEKYNITPKNLGDAVDRYDAVYAQHEANSLARPLLISR